MHIDETHQPGCSLISQLKLKFIDTNGIFLMEFVFVSTILLKWGRISLVISCFFVTIDPYSLIILCRKPEYKEGQETLSIVKFVVLMLMVLKKNNF